MRVVVQDLALPASRTVPVIGVESGTPGPTAIVTANLHGDETVGLGAVHALVELLPKRLLQGQVWLYPTLNPSGLAQGVRGLPGEDLDPNRAFPGSPEGRAAARHAHALWTDLLARRPHLVIDLHSDSVASIPYALVDRALHTGAAAEQRSRLLAAGSGLMVVHEYAREDYARYGLAQSLPGALLNGPGVPAVTLELGPRRLVQADAVALAVVSVLGVLSTAGLAAQPAPRHTAARDGAWRRVNGPRATSAGVLVPLVAPGQALRAETPVAEVRSLGGRVQERLLSGVSGGVLALPERAWVVPGQVTAILIVPE